MVCYCGVPADLVCVDCETPFCGEHLHALGDDDWQFVCVGCMDREMASVS
jgi:hypothetical protein